MLLLSAPYIGFATVFMMAVEMMVMALFMVMFMMNPAGLNPMKMVHQHALRRSAPGRRLRRPDGGGAAQPDMPAEPVAPGAPVIHDLGIELLGDSMLIFETAGVTLLATMVGAVVLSSRAAASARRRGVAAAAARARRRAGRASAGGRRRRRHHH